MARVVITYQFEHGDVIRMSAHADLEHPDVFDELTNRVLRIYRETVGTDEADIET